MLAISTKNTSCEACHNAYDPNDHYRKADHSADVTNTLDTSGFKCSDCHKMDLLSEHERTSSSSAGRSCSACHPTPYDSLTTWNQTCGQGGCHPTGSTTEPHSQEATGHARSAESTMCAASGCHDTGGDLAAVHATAASGESTSCLVCHSTSTFPATDVCQGCHTDKIDASGTVVPHAYDPVKHTSNVATASLIGTWPAAPDNGELYNPNVPYSYNATCGPCHPDGVLGSLHASATATPLMQVCPTCHPSPRDTLSPWNKTCVQGGCHPVNTPSAQHSNLTTAHAVATSTAEFTTGGCGATWKNGSSAVYPCHYSDLVQEHNRLISGYAWISVSCVQCHTSTKFAGLNGSWNGTCSQCHTDSHGVSGSARERTVYFEHQNPYGLYADGSIMMNGGHTGSNVITAHGPVPTQTQESPPKKAGCSTIGCHTFAYLEPGATSPSWPTVTCQTCHGAYSASFPATPYAGVKRWNSTRNANVNYTLTSTATTLPAGAYLDFMTRWNIEPYYDSGHVEISTNGGTTWTAVGGNITWGSGDGYAIDGDSGGKWVQAHFSLSAYVGRSVRFRFRYKTDSINTLDGWFIDQIVLSGTSGPIFTDGAEDPLNPAWTVVGWTRN